MLSEITEKSGWRPVREIIPDDFVTTDPAMNGSAGSKPMRSKLSCENNCMVKLARKQASKVTFFNFLSIYMGLTKILQKRTGR